MMSIKFSISQEGYCVEEGQIFKIADGISKGTFLNSKYDADAHNLLNFTMSVSFSIVKRGCGAGEVTCGVEMKDGIWGIKIHVF